MLAGCAQQVLGPQVNEATVRLLNRLGVEVVVARPRGCCGALVHHMGRTEASHAQAKTMIDAWIAEADGRGLDAIVINASGCGTTVKDYGHMFRDDPARAEKAARVSALAQDITEFLARLDMSGVRAPAETAVTYHSACSMQHGQQIKAAPVDLLRNAGFAVKEPAEGHLCCGSAGTYNMLQPELAGRLKARKIANLRHTQPDVIATGNIGCTMQLAGDVGAPVVHTVELLDWAAGGPEAGRDAVTAPADTLRAPPYPLASIRSLGSALPCVYSLQGPEIAAPNRCRGGIQTLPYDPSATRNSALRLFRGVPVGMPGQAVGSNRRIVTFHDTPPGQDRCARIAANTRAEHLGRQAARCSCCSASSDSCRRGPASRRPRCAAPCRKAKADFFRPSAASVMPWARPPSARMTCNRCMASISAVRKGRQARLSAVVGRFSGGTHRTALVIRQSLRASPSSGRRS